MDSNLLQPVLEGERVLVRPIEAADWPEMYAVASDPGIWEQHPSPDRYKESVFRAYFDDALKCGSGFTFVDRATGRIIGSSRYYGFDLDKSEVEIGWTFLSREFWGGLYNAEIKALMLEHAFTHVDTAVFMIGENNKRSRRAVEKIGGVLRPGEIRRGATDHVLYAISRQKYFENRE